jgi:hypothetical protein
MAHPIKHAQNSALRFGGNADDYLSIHHWFDESKAFFSDFRHRALRHHAEGIFLCERIFGKTITNSAGEQVPVRYVGEQHVKEDLGRIPTAQDWLARIHPQRWMYGQRLRDAAHLDAEPVAPEPAAQEKWRAVTHLYTDFLEIWRVAEDGSLEALVAQIPTDSGEDAQAKVRLATLIASLPDQLRTIANAPAPPQICGGIRGEEQAAQVLDWLNQMYIPWYRNRPELSFSNSIAT